MKLAKMQESKAGGSVRPAVTKAGEWKAFGNNGKSSKLGGRKVGYR